MTQTILVQKKDGRRGPLTEEHKHNISKAIRGITRSEETKAKMSMAALERCKDPADKAKMSARMIEVWKDSEHRANLSAINSGENNPMYGRTGENNPFFGKTHSEAAKIKMHEAGRLRVGENNPNWRNGASFKPYCPKFNNPLKEHYRNAYSRICAYCGKSEIFNGHHLSVHHIDGNKMQGCDDHDWFLVPLCKSCNSRGFERKPEYVFLFWLKDIERKHRSRQ